MVGTDGSSILADCWSESIGLIWGLAAAWHKVCIHHTNRGNSDWLTDREKLIHVTGYFGDSTCTGLMTQPTVSNHWRRVVSHLDSSLSHQAHLTMLDNMHVQPNYQLHRQKSCKKTEQTIHGNILKSGLNFKPSTNFTHRVS